MAADNRNNWSIVLPLCTTVAACVVLPFLHFGIPSGHDFEFHVNSWMEVVAHWKQGIVYPHWAATAHYGYGEARFIFYPPVSWTFGALLGLILPWKFVPAAYIILVLTVAGCSMFAAARHWLPTRHALWAAVFYTANPYHLVVVYWRSAFAELLAAAYFPLLLLLVLQLEDEGPRVVPLLSLLLAATWLTNIPAAVMMCYSLTLLVVCVAIYRRSVKPLIYGLLPVVFGSLLAAFYLVPVFHQRDWVNLSEVLAPGVRPVGNFIFDFSDDADHNRFNLIVSMVAVCEIVIFVCALWIARRKASPKLWWAVVVWGSAWALLMCKWTLPVWDHLPELRYIQFPWRPLVCMNVPIVIAVVIAIERWWLRTLIYAIALSCILFAWTRIQSPWWDSGDDMQEMIENQHNGSVPDGVDEYLPAGVDPDAVDQAALRARVEGQQHAQIRVDRWLAESRTIAVDSPASGNLVVRLFNYPRWRVTVNGHEVQTSTTEPAGEMIVPVDAGMNRIEIKWVEGHDRDIGGAISACALVALLAWFSRSRRPVGAIT